MSRLGDAVRRMGLRFEESLSGRWVKIHGHECAAFVAEGSASRRYLTWCDRWGAREVECYRTPEEAIAAGLRRAGGPAPPDSTNEVRPDQAGTSRSAADRCEGTRDSGPASA